jgi:hypothetical protein
MLFDHGLDPRGDPTSHRWLACLVLSSLFPSPGTNDKIELFRFDWQLTWYGRGNRITTLTLPFSASQQCEGPLNRVVDDALDYVQSVREAASR